MSDRTRSGGRIDRTRRIRFTFDGKTYNAHPGDTLASALLANGVRLVGRSFKYHRPRGIYSAGYEEPNALVELRTGARREPNTRATQVELFDGLIATSQNRFPSLAFDILALNGLASPAFMAGFYYKAFMWPAAFWERVYEPLIRRAAGLGRASGRPDPDHYEAVHAHCDVLVVGAGPAGLAAARAAGEAGARVLLCDQDFELGGGLLAEPAQAAWLADTLAALAHLPEVTLLPRTAVFGYYDHNVLGAIERVADHLAEPPPYTPRQRSWTIRAREVVLATGAIERLIAFPGNDLPGVMLAGAARTYAARFGVLAGRRVVVFANNDTAVPAAIALRDAGAESVTLVDVRRDSTGIARARASGIEVLADSEVHRVQGFRGVSLVRARRRSAPEQETLLVADLLAVSGGWNPAVNLASQSRARLVWDELLAAFIPGPSVQRERSAGAAHGVFGIEAAARDGAQAGAAAAAAAGFTPGQKVPLPDSPGVDATVLPFWEVKAPGKAFVDIQDDVTANDIRLAHAEGYRHIEHAKRYTTHAMGTDQGKTGGLVGAAVLAEARGESIAAVGLPTFRPYVTPVTWGAMAGPHVGKRFAPTRRTALHAWHVNHDAVMIEAGLWLRPSHYPRRGETSVWTTILREARTVRGAVGICDVSTLGKIDVQGPDAGAFLDRLYVNSFSSLAVGRARYGLMLREDGIVFDDGTTSKLAPDHFFVTTTTANAARVMEHMEFYAQTVWPELDVQFSSVTDQFAAMSIAGPRARDVVGAIVSGLDVSNAAFPFMAVGDGTVAGAPVRVFRISFSGELAFEIATPAGYAAHVWDTAMTAGEAFGIAPYGLEALNLLRIEKGHVAGAELDGNTTAADLGLARMMKKRGDFVGRALAQRPGLTDPDRPALVGLRPLDRRRSLLAGAHLVRKGSNDSQGWITSVTPSVALEGWLGLALLRGGPARIGERLIATHPLKNDIEPVEVVSPYFVDPENTRVRA